GFRTAWGRCWEAGGAPAYWPWTQALSALLEADGGALDRVAKSAADLATILPALRKKVRELPERPTADAESRFQLFSAVRSLLRALSSECPAAIVLDDLHAADQSSLELLQFIARSLRGEPLLVIATFRDVELPLSPAVGPA